MNSYKDKAKAVFDFMGVLSKENPGIAGATKEEIIETIGVSVLMGGGPAVAYGKRAYDALLEFQS